LAFDPEGKAIHYMWHFDGRSPHHRGNDRQKTESNLVPEYGPADHGNAEVVFPDADKIARLK
jgi:hypothetical protein